VGFILFLFLGLNAPDSLEQQDENEKECPELWLPLSATLPERLNLSG
jgi:hypothetical protein